MSTSGQIGDRRLYCVDTDLLVPGQMTFEISADGLSLHYRFERPGGAVANGVLSWQSRDVAERHYAQARDQILAGVGALDVRLTEHQQAAGRLPGTGTATRTDTTSRRTLLRTSHVTVTLYTNVAPPVWRLPRLYPRVVPSRRLLALRGGWLLAAFEISIETTRQAPAT